MHTGYINLPAKSIQYIHPFVVNKNIGHLELDEKKCQDIIQYINWVNINHKFNEEWFKIVETLLSQYKLSILNYMRKGFVRLFLSKNASVVMSFQKQINKIILLIRQILKQIHINCCLKDFDLDFFDPNFFCFRQDELLDDQFCQIKLQAKQIKLYQLVYKVNKFYFDCQKGIGNISESQLQCHLDNFQKIKTFFYKIQLKYGTQFNLFERKYLNQNQQKYKQQKQKYGMLLRTKIKIIPLQRACNFIKQAMLNNPLKKQTYKVQPFKSATNFCQSESSLDTSLSIIDKAQFNQKNGIKNCLKQIELLQNNNSRKKNKDVQQEKSAKTKSQMIEKPLQANRMQRQRNLKQTQQSRQQESLKKWIEFSKQNEKNNEHDLKQKKSMLFCQKGRLQKKQLQEITSESQSQQRQFSQQSHVEASSTQNQIQTNESSAQNFLEQPFLVYNRLCCRQYFIFNELVGPQSRDVQYKNYGFPWKPTLQLQLAKTVCAFLNCNGGNIYIGIEEDKQFVRKVVGYKYSETEKEVLHKSVRQICQTIQPDIVADQLYDVNFVPIKTNSTVHQNIPIFLKNTYIVKISICQGIDSQIYTLKNRMANTEEVCIRTYNEILSYKNISQILNIQKQRLCKKISIEKLYPHENPCDNKKFKKKHIQYNVPSKKVLKTDLRLQHLQISSNNITMSNTYQSWPKKIMKTNDIHESDRFQENVNPFQRVVHQNNQYSQSFQCYQLQNNRQAYPIRKYGQNHQQFQNQSKYQNNRKLQQQHQHYYKNTNYESFQSHQDHRRKYQQPQNLYQLNQRLYGNQAAKQEAFKYSKLNGTNKIDNFNEIRRAQGMSKLNSNVVPSYSGTREHPSWLKQVK